MLDVPTELVAFLGELLAQERVARGTRTGSRALSCTDQAVFALVWFRDSRDVPLIGKGMGISQATSYHYLDEAVGVLADRAPDLHDALQRGLDEGWSHVVLDGKVVDTDRLRVKKLSKKGKIIDAWYSARPMISAGTSRPCSALMDSRSGSPRSSPAPSTTSPPPARTSWRWRTLQHVTVSPSKITKIARAALVLTHFEHSYLPC